MTLTFTDVLASAAGGALGASLGALLAFSLMGGVCLVATSVGVAAGSTSLVGGLALGPVLGPHVAFAGGVAAAAYAAHRKQLDTARDIVTPLIGVGKVRLLLVGAAFGILGNVAYLGLGTVLGPGDDGAVALTDTIALSVVLTGLAAHLLWGRGAVPEGDAVWLAYQHTPIQVAAVGIAFGGASGWTLLAWPPDSRSFAPLFLYGLSALSLIAFQSARNVPVTHHVTLPAALAAALVLDTGGSDLAAITGAAAAGVLGASIAELWARVALRRSMIHLDPPAFAIAALATVLAILQLSLFQ